MKFNHLNVPTHWRNYWSRYPEGHTILEALISWVSQVDSMVDNQNKLNDNVAQFRNEIDEFVGRFDERLQDEVTQTLKDWQNSGFLDVVISSALQWQLDDYITTNEQDKVSLIAQLDHIVHNPKNPLKLSRLPSFATGEAEYNAASFIQDNLTTFNGYQYGVFSDELRKPVIAKRELPDGTWSLYPLSSLLGTTALNGHNVYAIAIDGDGYIHIAGNFHSQPLKYIRSTSPENIDSWQTVVMTGLNEAQASYPCFVKRKDGDLLFFYRDGGSGNGDYFINKYSRTTKTWVQLTKLINGKANAVSPYLNHVTVDKTGTIHISGTFRHTAGGNRDIFYMRSKTGGNTWENSTGGVYTLPATLSTIEIIKTVSATEELLNQNGMETDDNGNPHITYFKKDSRGFTNIFYLRNIGLGWVEQQVTYLDKAFTLNNWKGEISRPSIFTIHNRVFIIYRANYGGKKGTVNMIEVTPGIAQFKEFSILNIDLHAWEPVFDTQALYERNELHMLIIPTMANPFGTSKEYHLDNFSKQYLGVLSIDLNQIDKLIRKEVRLPELKIKRTSIGAKQTISTSGVVTFPNYAPIVIVGQDPILFARLTVRGKAFTNIKLTPRLRNVNFEGSTTVNYFNSLVIDQTVASVNLETPWRPIPVNNGNGLIEIEALVELLNEATTVENTDLSAITIEVAEIVY